MSKPTILIVDDEAYIAELLVELLSEELDYDVQSAYNGLQALAVVRDRMPALVITDLMMPFMDGHSLVRALRDEPSTSDLPILTMSAVRNRPQWISDENLHFLAKPFDPTELLDTVQDILSSSADSPTTQDPSR